METPNDHLSSPTKFMNQEERKDVHEESQSVGRPKSNSHEALAKIDIDMKLATHILLNEARKGSSAENVVCSPLSLEFALHTVAAGSKGETLSQILQFIGSKGNQLHAMEDLNLKSLGIMRVASSYSCKDHRNKEWYEEEEPELSFANGVWVDQRYELKPSYKELMSSVYDAKVEAVDFRNQANEVVGGINLWVADKTKGLIEEILAPGSLSETTMLILVNALYIKGFWNEYCQFDYYMTEYRDFYILDGSKVSVPFMSRCSPTYYFRAFDGFKVLQLDYRRGDDKLREFCMQILLPDERDGLQNLINRCNSDPGFLRQDFGLKLEEFKELWVPRFKFTYTLQDVSGMMEELGLTLPFMRDCQDLTEMVEMPDGASLSVSKILHKATIEVTEGGVEASTNFTEVDYGTGCDLYSDFPPPPTLRFVADHPFIFVIKEEKTGTIFFVGAVFNPLLEMNQEEKKDVHEESQAVGPKFNAHEALAKINIDLKLATRILLNEAGKGSSAKNVMCSPLSLEFALHTVAAGSKGETLSQILQFIGSKGNQLPAMEDLNLKSLGIMRVASSYSCNCKDHRNKEWDEEEEPELSFANGVWVNQCYDLKPSYKELMSSIYNANAEAVDFGNQADEVVRDINSWVSDKTKGLIKEILSPGSLSETTMLILVNALYFKGFWEEYSKFDEDITVDRDFYIIDGSKVSVSFMSRAFPRYYFRAFDGFKVLQLGYQRGNDKLREFCMQILLPDERDGLQNLINRCISDPGFLHQDFGLKLEEFKEVWVPKFKFTYTLQDVSGIMEELGLTLPFINCQDLTEMVEMPDGASLSVSKILHKATIEVNEAGVEAAAVTEVEYDVGCSLDDFPPPPTLRFVADHPFIFVIKEGKTGAIFFFGAVFNPILED